MDTHPDGTRRRAAASGLNPAFLIKVAEYSETTAVGSAAYVTF